MRLFLQTCGSIMVFTRLIFTVVYLCPAINTARGATVTVAAFLPGGHTRNLIVNGNCPTCCSHARLRSTTHEIPFRPSSLLQSRRSDTSLLASRQPSPPPESWQTKVINTVTNDSKRSVLFSISSIMAGATLGPFLDTYHSNFGVLQYNSPFSLQLWSANQNIPALVTTWWVPYLFGLAGFIIGWLYILLDSLFISPSSPISSPKPSPTMGYSPPIILIGVSFFTFQYWLSGILYSYNIDRTIIFAIMSVCSYIGFTKLDNTKSGLITSIATAVGGPLIEVGLISLLAGNINGYHYTDAGETGFFPLWVVPVYFLGGPANGNLARGTWDALGSSAENEDNGE